MSTSIQARSRALGSFRSKQDVSPHSPRIHLAWTTYFSRRILQIMHHMYAFQITATQTLRLSETVTDPRTTMGLHLNGFHRTTPSVLGIHFNFGNRLQTL